MFFNKKNLIHYIIAFGTIFAVTSLINKAKEGAESTDDYKLIQDYLLNESPLYGYNRPKLWIHSKYEINARKWKDYYSRNTTNLNQPYLHLTIKSIINHCGEDFNICLIDDESFTKLLPSWDVNVSSMAEPMKSQYREMGMARLLQIYGGLVVPNSFLCIRNLKSFYDENLENGKPFICENINHTCNSGNNTSAYAFMPNTYIMGATKNDESILELVDFMKGLNSSTHITDENKFVGSISQKCMNLINDQKMNLVGGEIVGVKTNNRKAILLDDLMEEAYLDINNSAVGIYIPAEEILIRPKYQWFAVLPCEQILKTKMIIAKYLVLSTVDSTNEYYKEKREHSVVTI
jgi:hypothetical protein